MIERGRRCLLRTFTGFEFFYIEVSCEFVLKSSLHLFGTELPIWIMGDPLHPSQSHICAGIVELTILLSPEMSFSAVNADTASCIRSEPEELCNSRPDDQLLVGQHYWSFRHEKLSI